MPSLFGRRASCFYCGQRSARQVQPGLRQWTCTVCDATNFLDASGNITEPPAAAASSVSTPSAPRFAQPVARTSYSPPAANESLFCNDCVKNQQLVERNLANYLPLPTDPRYAEFEARLPDYKRSLEARYPQVCADCAPRVRERIRDTGYAAKADHLRRTVTQHRSLGPGSHHGAFLPLLAWIGGACWLLAGLTSVLWHLAGILQDTRDEDLSDSSHLIPLAVLAKSQAAVKILYAYNGELERLADLTAVLTVVSLWWHPMLGSLSTRRISGFGEYYKLQAIICVARASAWHFLSSHRAPTLEYSVRKAAHGVLLVFNVIAPVLAYRSIWIRPAPAVSFSNSLEPITPKATTRTANAKSSKSMDSIEPESFFQISKLGPTKAACQARPPPIPIPVPIPTHDPDAMDIDTPVATSHLAPGSAIDDSPSTRAPRQGEALFDTFSQNRHAEEMNSDITPAPHRSLFGSKDAIVKPAKFFAPESMVTGLENVFAGFFSLGDEPPELRRPGDTSTTSADPVLGTPPESSGVPWQRLLSTIFLVLAVYLWKAAEGTQRLADVFRFSSLGIAAAITGQHFLAALSSTVPSWSLSDILLFALEVMVAIGFGYQLQQSKATRGGPEAALGPFPAWFLLFLIVQEVLGLLASLFKGSRVTVATSESPPRTSTGERLALAANDGRLRERSLDSSIASLRPLPTQSGQSKLTNGNPSFTNSNQMMLPSSSHSFKGLTIDDKDSEDECGGIASLSLGAASAKARGRRKYISEEPMDMGS